MFVVRADPGKTRDFLFVLQGQYLETILWCSSFKYVHATCIVAFISFFIMGNNNCCLAHLAVCFNVFCKHVLLAEQTNEFMNYTTT